MRATKQNLGRDFLKTRLSGRVPDLWVRGRLAILPGTGPLVRGIYIDRTSIKDCVNPYVFLLATYVPHTYFTFSHMVELGRGAWILSSPEVRDRLGQSLANIGVPYLRSISSLSDFALLLEREMRDMAPVEDEYKIEEYAYTLILLDRKPDADRYLSWLAALTPGENGVPSYFENVRRRAAELLEQDGESSIERLERFSEETLKSLRIPRKAVYGAT